MKQLKITVNGKAYDVTVEEMGGTAPVATPAPVAAPTPVAAPAPAAAPAPVEAPAPVATSGEGEPVNAPMNGNIVDVKVSVGQSVKTGDVLVILEAMKMENEIVAPKDGVIGGVLVNKGDTVDTGAALVTIK